MGPIAAPFGSLGNQLPVGTSPASPRSEASVLLLTAPRPANSMLSSGKDPDTLKILPSGK